MGVSVNQARNFYTKNRDKFPGMSMTEAVEQMVRGGEIPVAPVQAAPAATAPAPAAAPVPEVVAPAPEVAAPPPMNPYELALSTYNQENPVVAAAPAAKGAPVDYVARARQEVENSRRAELEANAKISRETKLAPEMQKLIDDRLARYGIELTEADKDRQQATWMAVAQAGMKMAQSQSPYFMQALASGMEAGVNGYSEAKAKAAEKKARLQEAKEDLSIKAIELRDQAVKDAISARVASKQAAAADRQLLKDALGVEVAGATAGDVVKSAALGNRLTEAQISKIFSDMANDKVRLAIARATAGRDRNGGSGGVKLSQLNPIVNGAISENNRLTEQLRDPYISSQLSPAEKSAMQGKIRENEKLIRYGRSLQQQRIGMGGMTFGQEK